MSTDTKTAMETLERQLNHDRAELVKKLMELGNKYDPHAQEEAMHFARNPEDEKAKLHATRALLRCDVHHAAISDAIQLIKLHWPNIQRLAPMMMTKEAQILKVLP